MIMISENFSLVFQEKKNPFPTETVTMKVLKVFLGDILTFPVMLLNS